ncbi:MAG: LIC11966 family surface protein [Bacteroidia bacterium]
MLKKCILSLVTVSSMILTSCGPSQDDAIKYNDQIVAIQKALLPAQDAFISQIDGHNKDSLKLTQANFSEKSKTALEQCQKMPEFNGKREYLDASIEYFKVTLSLADNEAKQIMAIMTKDSAQVTDKDVADVTACATKFDKDYANILKKVQEAQAAFSKEWKFDVRSE